MSEAMSGSEEAAWEIAQTYTPYIIRTAQSNLTPQLQSKIDPQDLAQSVWATILLKGSDLSRLKSPKDLIAYLATATKNRVIDKARRYKSEVRNVQREESLGGTARLRRERRRVFRRLLCTPATKPRAQGFGARPLELDSCKRLRTRSTNCPTATWTGSPTARLA